MFRVLPCLQGRYKPTPAVIEALDGASISLLYLKPCVRKGKDRWARHPAAALPADFVEKLSLTDWRRLGASPSSVKPVAGVSGVVLDARPRARRGTKPRRSMH